MLRSILLMSRPPLLCEEGNVLSHELVKLKLRHYPGSEKLAFAFEAVNFASPIINSVLEIINSASDTINFGFQKINRELETIISVLDMVICGRNKMNILSRRSSCPFWK